MLTLSILIVTVARPVQAEEALSLPVQIAHNIAEKYASEEIINDANMLWLIPDMATYSELFPESENTVSETNRQLCLDKIISTVKGSDAPATLAKAIIALRSLGYDAKKLYTKELEEIDIVSRLTGIVDGGEAGVTSVYTLPYVLIALQQGNGYATDEQISFLVETLLASKQEWQDTTWGPDTATPVILALAPYYDENEQVKAAIDSTIPIITALQEESGIISNAASTGLVLAALSSVGINPKEVIKNDNSLIDGLLSQACEELNGFLPMSNTFSTEQGFRGLLGWLLFENNVQKRVYDFSEYPMNEAYETRNICCPVSFSVTPDNAQVTIEGFTPGADGIFMLPEGEYSYTVSKSGYKPFSGNVTITADDISALTGKSVSVALERYSSGGGSIGPRLLRIKVNVMAHGDECGNEYTYKDNKNSFEALVSTAVTINPGESVYDALSEALSGVGINFTENDGYVSSIGDYAEFDHGNRSGWMFTLDGKHMDTGCRETKLTKNSTLIWFYTDDYTKERGSEEYDDSDGHATYVPSFGLSGKSNDISQRKIINQGKTFDDIAEHKNKSEIEALAERGIINGKTEAVYEPDSTMTRAEFATIVTCALGLPEKNITKFNDITEEEWFCSYINSAYFYGIVSGVSQESFNPYGTITREEAAAMVTRAAKLAGVDTELNILTAKNILAEFTDYNDVSVWAFSALGFCYSKNILDRSPIEIKPKENVKRGEVAYMIYNMLKGAKLV